jgi:transcriptional regulator GlxA family with amidase domain
MKLMSFTEIAILFFSLTAGITGNTESKPTGKAIRVAILLYDGVQVLDVAGPLEVFTASTTEIDGKRTPAFEVYMVATNLEPVKANNAGNVYVPQYSLDNAPDPQILVVPGGDTTRAEGDSRLITWIRKKSETSELTASVCTGAFLLAKAGLLDKKSATTHWYFIERLDKEFPEIDVRKDVRFVDSGKIVTSAGISAGIDMALHIVKRYYGSDTAQFTAKVMQYESSGWMQ